MVGSEMQENETPTGDMHGEGYSEKGNKLVFQERKHVEENPLSVEAMTQTLCKLSNGTKANGHVPRMDAGEGSAMKKGELNPDTPKESAGFPQHLLQQPQQQVPMNEHALHGQTQVNQTSFLTHQDQQQQKSSLGIPSVGTVQIVSGTNGQVVKKKGRFSVLKVDPISALPTTTLSGVATTTISAVGGVNNNVAVPVHQISKGKASLPPMPPKITESSSQISHINPAPAAIPQTIIDSNTSIPQGPTSPRNVHENSEGNQPTIALKTITGQACAQSVTSVPIPYIASKNNQNGSDSVVPPGTKKKGRFIVSSADVSDNPINHVSSGNPAVVGSISHVRKKSISNIQTIPLIECTSSKENYSQIAPEMKQQNQQPNTVSVQQHNVLQQQYQVQPIHGVATPNVAVTLPMGNVGNQAQSVPTKSHQSNKKIMEGMSGTASNSSSLTTKVGLLGTAPGGMGKMFHFLDQMKLEAIEADKIIKSLQSDNKFLRGKNKELEAKVNDVEKRNVDEKAAREALELKVRILKKRVKELKNTLSRVAPDRGDDCNVTEVANSTCSSNERLVGDDESNIARCSTSKSLKSVNIVRQDDTMLMEPKSQETPINPVQNDLHCRSLNGGSVAVTENDDTQRKKSVESIEGVNVQHQVRDAEQQNVSEASLELLDNTTPTELLATVSESLSLSKDNGMNGNLITHTNNQQSISVSVPASSQIAFDPYNQSMVTNCEHSIHHGVFDYTNSMQDIADFVGAKSSSTHVSPSATSSAGSSKIDSTKAFDPLSHFDPLSQSMEKLEVEKSQISSLNDLV